MGVSLDSLAEKLFDNFKKITPALVASAILTGLLLFLPKSILVSGAIGARPHKDVIDTGALGPGPIKKK